MAKKRTSKLGQLTDSEALEEKIKNAPERIAEATGQPVSSSSKYLEAAKKGAELRNRKNKRKDYASDKGRKRYNTMMHPQLKEILNNIATAEGITVPDLIEKLLCEKIGIEPPSE